MKKTSWTLIVLAMVTLIGCKKDKQEEVPVECADTISYASDVATILSTSCNTSGCHNAASAASGYVFENHAQVSDNASIILNVIRHNSGFQAMPQGALKLSNEQIDKIACWVQQGKLNN
jgi:mono/diheme cytochrome c family protein